MFPAGGRANYFKALSVSLNAQGRGISLSFHVLPTSFV
jgi:hypothetical protein